MKMSLKEFSFVRWWKADTNQLYDRDNAIHHALKRAWSCGYNAGVRRKGKA